MAKTARKPQAASGRDRASDLTAAQQKTPDLPAEIETADPAASGRDRGRDLTAAQESAAAILPLHLVDENPDNPRTAVDAEADAELTASIGAKGVLQPIMVRPSPREAGRYEVVMGSRRRRCALAAGQMTIPAVIRETLDDGAAFELATIENVQRDDMNPMDVARAYRRMIDARLKGNGGAEPPMSLKAAKEDVARIVGKSVRIIELRLEFLEKLPPIKQAELQAGKISAKDATAWIREQPDPLSDRALLAFAEIVEAWKTREKPPATWYDGAEVQGRTVRTEKADHTKVDVKVDDDKGVLAELKKRRMIEGVFELREDGVDLNRHFVRLSYHWAYDVQLPPEVKACKDDKARRELIDRLRAKVLSPSVLPLVEGAFATEWLNGPFETAPEIEAELARKREERERANAEADAQQEAAQREHAEKVQAAKDRWAKGGEVEARLAALKMDDAAEIAGELADLVGVKFPLHVSENGVVTDAAGAVVVERPYGYQDTLRTRPQLRMLVALANATLGHVMPPWPAGVKDADDLPRDQFVQVIAGCLVDDCDDLPEDDAEALFEATERAGKGLDAFLAQEGIQYGDPAYDWQEVGAMAIAQGIREDGLGQDAAPPAGSDDDGDSGEGADVPPPPAGEEDPEGVEGASDSAEAHADEPPAYLRRLAGGGAAEARP